MIRQATESDIKDIMNIIDQAKQYFKENHINQWQDGEPNKDMILEDISHNKSYVLTQEDHIIGTCYIALEEEPTYSYIEGEWLTKDTPYYVMHRIAVDTHYKGVGNATSFIEHTIKLALIDCVQSIRIDTHKDNLSMQRFLKKHGFKPCGTIYLKNGDPRIGFEKIL